MWTKMKQNSNSKDKIVILWNQETKNKNETQNLKSKNVTFWNIKEVNRN